MRLFQDHGFVPTNNTPKEYSVDMIEESKLEVELKKKYGSRKIPAEDVLSILSDLKRQGEITLNGVDLLSDYTVDELLETVRRQKTRYLTDPIDLDQDSLTNEVGLVGGDHCKYFYKDICMDVDPQYKPSGAEHNYTIKDETLYSYFDPGDRVKSSKGEDNKAQAPLYETRYETNNALKNIKGVHSTGPSPRTPTKPEDFIAHRTALKGLHNTPKNVNKAEMSMLRDSFITTDDTVITALRDKTRIINDRFNKGNLKKVKNVLNAYSEYQKMKTKRGKGWMVGLLLIPCFIVFCYFIYYKEPY